MHVLRIYRMHIHAHHHNRHELGEPHNTCHLGRVLARIALSPTSKLHTVECSHSDVVYMRRNFRIYTELYVFTMNNECLITIRYSSVYLVCA